MPIWLRFLIIGIIVLCASSFLWFVIGSTSYLQRGMDIIGTTYLMIAGIPILLLGVLAAALLIKGWAPISGIHYIGIFVGLVTSILLSIILLHSVNSQGWTKDDINKDTLKAMVNGNYEYRIELINLFRRNSNAKLYLRNVDSGEEKYIPVNIQTHKIVALGLKDVNHWIKLEPTVDPSRYILYTTKELGIPEEKFEIDIGAETSIRLQ